MRSGLCGVRNVVYFNWPYYAGAFLSITGILCAALLDARAVWFAIVPLWFTLSSLAATALVYDFSDLYRFSWLERLPVFRTAVNINAGFDETTALLRARGLSVQSGDFFDAEKNTEPSIQRARRIFPSSDSVPLSELNRAEAALFLLSAHEMRTEEARAGLLLSVRRSSGAGLIVIVEHLRNVWNFLAYGPGFLHFHSNKTWRQTFKAAGLDLLSEFDITPFVRCYVLK